MTLTWSENCVLTSKAYTEAVAGDNPVLGINAPINATFRIIDTNLYVPIVTLLTKNNNKIIRTIKNKSIKWNKYGSEMSNQTKNNTINYLIDPTFTKVNRLFVLSFKNEEDRT